MEKAKKSRKPPKKGAKTKKAANAAPAAPLRRNYTHDTKADAKDLYLRGVALDRIGRYLGVPVRTLTNWQTEGRWTEAKDPASAALDLRARGFRVAEIATRLETTERTVYKWLKAAAT